MSIHFAELDHRDTPLGELTLRRRRVAALDDQEVFEVKLGDAFLMSSLFHEVEVALADLGLAATAAPDLDVVVGGLGLGYTARAALRHRSVRTLLVIDALSAVIEWHERGLVPLGPELARTLGVVSCWATSLPWLRQPAQASTPRNRAAAFTPCCSTSTTHHGTG